MAAPPAKDDLETLEQARAQLEAALAGDEFWRALRQPASSNAQAKPAARRARNARLEKALASNELYKAWKQLNQAIDTLRAQLPEAPTKTELGALAQTEPQPAASAEPGRPRRRRLQSEIAARAAGIAQGLSDESETLMGRLADVTPAAEAASAPVTPRGHANGASGGDPDSVAKETFAGLSNLRDPPEATVTFVVRETPRGRPAAPARGSGAQDPVGAFRRAAGATEAQVDIRSTAAPEQRTDPSDAAQASSKPQPIT